MTVFVTIFGGHPEDRPIYVRPRERIPEEATLAVELGPAPDGLPLVLRIERASTVASSILNVLGESRSSDLPAELAEALDRIEEAVQTYGRRRGVVAEGPPRLSVPAYLTRTTVARLTDATLLARALGTHSPLLLPEDLRLGESRPEREAITTAVMRAGPAAAEAAARAVTGNRRLGVPCGDGPPWIADWEADSRDPKPPRWTRPFRFESIERIEGASYIARGSGREWRGPLSARRDYRRTVQEADGVGWTLPRRCVAESIAQTAEALGDLHSQGCVHGDIKPHNVLLLAEGAWPIDALNLRVGQLAPAATPGWAAPEQILARDVSTATDVFPLGLMAASLVGAAVHGEERAFVIPTGGSRRRRIRLLISADVYVDADAGGLPPAGAPAWRELILRAVSFEPEKRFADGAAFAAALRGILKDFAPKGDAPLGAGPGLLARNVVVREDLQPAWLLTDAR